MSSRSPAVAVDDSVDSVEDEGRNWGIHACAHGCLHLSLDRITLTLTPEEFGALLDLMHRARGRFQRPRVFGTASRSH